jgi:hypothetical protein
MRVIEDSDLTLPRENAPPVKTAGHFFVVHTFAVGPEGGAKLFMATLVRMTARCQIAGGTLYCRCSII